MTFLFESGNFLQSKYLEYLNVPELLKRTFQNSGILYPILYTQVGNFYFIIDGIKRLKFALKSKIDIEFKKIESNNIKEFIMLRKQISEYNLLEKIEILKNFENSEEYSDIFKLLGFKKNSNIKIFLENFYQLPETVLYAMANNKIKSKNIDIWGVFEINEIEQILSLIEGLTFNVNQEKRFLEYLLYIKVNFHDLEQIFYRIKEIVLSQQTSTQKISRILEYLDSLCYPDYRKIIERFNSLKKELQLPEGMSLTYLDNGEDSQFKFEFSFTNIEEFNNSIEILNNIKKTSKMNEFLTIFIPDGE